MELTLENLIKLIDERASLASRPVSEQTSDMNSAATANGTGVVTKITYSETGGILITVRMCDDREEIATPGPSPVVLHERVTVVGGRIFN